ncbi:MAG: hypothetical protein EP330_17540 [Deltaproteobacteria bacterium]|nr:MAG: hypothetical protein EP330_17540 [Deltaproteobacteria bacterium]
MIRYLPVVLVLVACKKPPEAPAELDELSRYLYGSWGAEDAAEREVGIANLITFMADVDLNGNVQDRSWELTPITEAELWDINWPQERNPADVLGVSVARETDFEPADHAGLQILADQLELEPSASAYTRRFVEVSDPSCFVDGSCDPLFTENDVTRQNALISVDFVLYKDFRWVETENGDALFARSYVDQVWEGNSGSSRINQSYSCDLWIPDGQGGGFRYQTLWSESDTAGSDAVTIAVLKSSIDNILETGDEVLAAAR